MTRALWALVAFLALIMIVVAARRILHLWSPAVDLDAGFARHPLLTLAHIVPGLAFIVLGPFQFMPGLRRRHLELHRWTGRVFLASGLVIGVTALVMSPQMAIGGALESAATLTFGLLFLFALGKAFVAIRARRIAEHRRWIIQGYALGLAVATVRPIMGVSFATSRLTHLTPHHFFGIAFWLGFTISLAAAELRIGRPASRRSVYSNTCGRGTQR